MEIRLQPVHTLFVNSSTLALQLIVISFAIICVLSVFLYCLYCSLHCSIFRIYIEENTRADTEIQILDVVNQGERTVTCTILSGNIQGTQGPLFSLEPTGFNKNCMLILRGELDYEKQTEYRLEVQVSKSRKKRQCKIIEIPQ